MKLKNFIKKILVTSAMLFVVTGNSFAAKAPEYTVPNQYPAKYTPEYIKEIKPI